MIHATTDLMNSDPLGNFLHTSQQIFQPDSDGYLHGHDLKDSPDESTHLQRFLESLQSDVPNDYALVEVTVDIKVVEEALPLLFLAESLFQ